MNVVACLFHLVEHKLGLSMPPAGDTAVETEFTNGQWQAFMRDKLLPPAMESLCPGRISGQPCGATSRRA